MRIPSLIVLLIALVTFGCSGSKNSSSTPSTSDTSSTGRITRAWSLAIGSGGGISGKYQGYTIRSNRTAYSWVTDQNTPATNVTLDADVIDYLRESFNAMNFRAVKFNNPYNLTYFMELHEGDSTYSIRWGDSRLPPPESVQVLYSTINAFMRERTAK